jgi:hypothetical protein
MSAKLSVIFYIILCLEIGAFLTVGPWWPHGMWGISDWGNNYFSVICREDDGHSGNTDRCRIGLGPWRREWHRAFESRHCFLGNLQLQKDSRGFASAN